MRHDKEFRRPDGSTVRVSAMFFISLCGEIKWDFIVMSKAAKKRKWEAAPQEWLHVPYDDREEVRRAAYLKLATEAEVDETMLELWEKLKPC